jgi:hypothetical protein
MAMAFLSVKTMWSETSAQAIRCGSKTDTKMLPPALLAQICSTTPRLIGTGGQG